MNKPGLALISGTGQPELDRFCQGVKQTLDSMTGQAKNVPTLQPLPTTATNAEIIDRLNALLDRLQ